MSLCQNILAENNKIKMAVNLPVIKKRDNELENEVKWKYHDPCNVVIPCSYGDRFIPRRYALNNIDLNGKFFKEKEKNEDVIHMRSQDGYWRQYNLKVNLCNMFNIKQQRILQFHDLSTTSQIKENFKTFPQLRYPNFINQNKLELDWPCKPRIRPLLYADSTHDLPFFSTYSEFNIISWSKKGLVAAAFGSDLVIWAPRNDDTVVYKIKYSKSLAFSPEGSHIAIGVKSNGKPVLELWQTYDDNILFFTNSFTFKEESDEISCIEWSPNSASILCGTKSGKIYLFSTPSLKRIKILQGHTSRITSVKFNPKSKYFASNDENGNIIIRIWPTCIVHLVIKSKYQTNTFMDWHPWNGVDLAYSESFPGSIKILNVQKNETVAHYLRKGFFCMVDALTFSKISGELVISCCIQENDSESFSCEVLVMASLTRIVDVLKTHDDRVKVLMWNPDGTQLATAGDDDTLTIWNFLGGDCTKKTKIEKESQKNSNKINVSAMSQFKFMR